MGSRTVRLGVVVLVSVAALFWAGSALDAAGTDDAVLVVHKDFESAGLDGLRCSGNCPSIVQSSSAGGGSAARFTLTRGMRTPYRSEAVLTGGDGHFEMGEEYWVGLSYRFEDWATDSDRESAPLQVHSTPGRWGKECSLGSAYSTAPFFVSTGDGLMRFVTYGGRTLWEGPIERQVWSNITVNFKVSAGSDGFVEAWVDGERLGRVDGANSPRVDKCGLAMRDPYLKIGVYKWNWKTGRPATESTRREVWIDDVKIAAGSDGYDLVTPDTGGGPGTTIVVNPTTTTQGGQPITTTVSPDEPGLVAHYTLDDVTGGTAIDSSGNGNDGAVSGAVAVSGRIGGALDFDGDSDHVDVGSFDVEGSGLTLSAWIKADDFGTHDARIVSKATGTAAQDHYWMLSTIEDDGIKPRVRVRTGGKTVTLIGDRDIPVGQWVHVAATYDGANIRVFVDGEDSGVVAKSGPLDVNPLVGVLVGDNPVSGQRSFDGAIDDLRVYDRGLSGDEIRALAKTTTTPPTTTTPTTNPPTTNPPTTTTTVPPSTTATTTATTTPPTTTPGGGGPKPSGRLIFSDGFESGLDAFRCSGNCPTVTASEKTSGERSGRFVLTRDMPTGYRTEVVLKDGKGQFEFGGEYWLQLSFRPEDYERDSKSETAPLQIHAVPSRWDSTCYNSSSGAASGLLRIHIAGDELDFGVFGSRSIATAPIERNEWVTVLWHFKVSGGSDGFIEVWKDGVKLGRIDGKNQELVDKCGSTRAPYLKLGVYKWPWRKAPSDVSRREMLIDDIKIWREE